MEKTEEELRKLQGVIQGYINLLQRYGLPPELAKLVTELERLIFLFNSLRRAILAYKAVSALVSAGGLAAIATGGGVLAVAEVGLFGGMLLMDMLNEVDIRRD